MKNLRLALFIVVALVQLAVPASVLWQREQTMRRGRAWKFWTAPVDPVDAIRGRYIYLRFAAEELPAGQTAPTQTRADDFVYAILKEGADGFAEVDHLSDVPVKGDNVVKVEAGYIVRDRQQVRFPFDHFWITEANAVAADKAYAENSRRDKQNAYATVRVRNGDAALEQLYIDGLPLAQYLRAHPTP